MSIIQQNGPLRRAARWEGHITGSDAVI